ncbi:MAG: complement resistance protein TraT [Nitrospira sp.]|nr:complement resistance protein TraT [Nitrospira sp.]
MTLRPRKLALTTWLASALALIWLLEGGCSNIIRSGLMNSNTVFLDPSLNRTAYVQLRNISENQSVTLNDIRTKLTGKGYQLTDDPEQANYWIQAKVVYCHKGADGVTPEGVAKAGSGAGISSGGTTMAAAGPTDADRIARLMPGGMAGMGVMPMGGGMPDMNAMMAQAMAMSGGRGGFGGMQMPQAPKEEGVIYLCVADVQITDRKLGKPLGRPADMTGAATDRKGDGSLPKVQQMRTVGHVRQKDLDIPEATPIIQEKISTGIAGLF